VKHTRDELLEQQEAIQMAGSQVTLRLVGMVDTAMAALSDYRAVLLSNMDARDPYVSADIMDRLLAVFVALRQTGHVVPLMEAWAELTELHYNWVKIQGSLHVRAMDAPMGPQPHGLIDPLATELDYLDGE
jgi:hypothetical protein